MNSVPLNRDTYCTPKGVAQSPSSLFSQSVKGEKFDGGKPESVKSGIKGVRDWLVLARVSVGHFKVRNLMASSCTWAPQSLAKDLQLWALWLMMATDDICFFGGGILNIEGKS